VSRHRAPFVSRRTPTPVTRSLLAVPLLLVCLTADAGAQATASLGGRVVDAQEAAVPGAAVTLRRTETSAVWSTTSDGDGRFAFPVLAPGRYDVGVRLDGFSPWRSEGMTLEVG